MKNLESEIFDLCGKKWFFEVQDQNEIMRASGGKKIVVLLKDAAGRFNENEKKEWLINIGQVYEIKKINPRGTEAKEFIEDEIKKLKMNEKQQNELLLLKQF